MSITLQFPPQCETLNQQAGVNVNNGSVSPSGTLVSQRTLTLNQDQKAIVAVQLPIGEYLVVASLTVSGTPAPTDVVPALIVGYSDGSGFTALGPTSSGSSVINGFTVTQSVTFAHDGLSAIHAGVIGGTYSGAWTYNITVSIYKQ